MTGWRLGWVVAAEERVDEMIKVHQYVQACASAPAQYAAEAALTGGEETAEAVSEMRAAFEERRDLVLDGLAAAGLDCPTPRGAFYAFPAVPEGFVDACLERDVVTVPGSAFGDAGAGHARLSYAASVEELEEALERIADAVAALR
jgi:aspartate aminotransferase